jgi:hypothetical protein
MEKSKKLQDLNPSRPSIEENMYIFQRLQIYLANEARNKAAQSKQEYHWEDYM